MPLSSSPLIKIQTIFSETILTSCHTKAFEASYPLPTAWWHPFTSLNQPLLIWGADTSSTKLPARKTTHTGSSYLQLLYMWHFTKQYRQVCHLSVIDANYSCRYFCHRFLKSKPYFPRPLLPPVAQRSLKPCIPYPLPGDAWFSHSLYCRGLSKRCLFCSSAFPSAFVRNSQRLLNPF